MRNWIEEFLEWQQEDGSQLSVDDWSDWLIKAVNSYNSLSAQLGAADVFYALTVKQRDQAWEENKNLREMLRKYGNHYESCEMGATRLWRRISYHHAHVGSLEEAVLLAFKPCTCGFGEILGEK